MYYLHLPVEHSIERKVILLVLIVANRDDLLEAFHQDSQHQQRESHRAHVDN